MATTNTFSSLKPLFKEDYAQGIRKQLKELKAYKPIKIDRGFDKIKKLLRHS